VLVAVVGAAALVGSPLGAGATPRAPAELSVTSPAGPTDVTPGTPATASLIVGNLGHDSLAVQISSQGVQLLNNGKTRFDQPVDPRFAGRIHVAPATLTVPGRQKRVVEITVDVPPGLRPDDYFLGFLVTPIVNAPSVAVVNQVGGLVVLNAPGPRLRRLTASVIGPPRIRFTFGRSANGIVRVKNVGDATVQFAATTQTDGWPAASQPYRTDAPQLLPPGLSRDLPVHVATPFGLGWYTIRTTVVYNITDRTTGEVVATRRVVIVNPLLCVPVLMLAVGLAWRRHRRPRAARRVHAAHRRRPGARRVPAAT
jgi:hypothetical protein